MWERPGCQRALRFLAEAANSTEREVAANANTAAFTPKNKLCAPGSSSGTGTADQGPGTAPRSPSASPSPAKAASSSGTCCHSNLLLPNPRAKRLFRERRGKSRQVKRRLLGGTLGARELQDHTQLRDFSRSPRSRPLSVSSHSQGHAGGSYCARTLPAACVTPRRASRRGAVEPAESSIGRESNPSLQKTKIILQ